MADFKWDREHTVGLAKLKCAQCHGLGMWVTDGKHAPCKCVLRAIFRQCLREYRSVRVRAGYFSRTHVERCADGIGSGASFTYGHKDLEFAADFILIVKRHLDAAEWKLFRLYFLLGADWRLSTKKLSIDRGNFFHAVYRIEARLGRVFREMKPYALYPIDEYYSGARLGALTKAA